MAKRSWFSIVKRFFTSDTQLNRKKERKRRWLLGKHNVRRLASISAPSVPRERIIPSETVEDQQSNLAANTVINTTDTAAEVVEHTALSHPTTDGNEEESKEVSHVYHIQLNAPNSKALSCECETGTREAAAIKIQIAFRGYLARKALRALKGLVRLQAIIRGRAVRRQAITTLKRLQSIVNIQSQVCARRIQMAEETPLSQENKELLDFRGKDIKIDINSQRRWDDSILSKEEERALFSSKREAAMKRERIKEYAFNHRLSTESEQNKMNGKWKYWLEQWVDTQLAKQDLQNPDAVSPSDIKSREELEGRKLRLRNLKGLDSPAYFPRRSFHHRKQHSIGDQDSSFAGSPTFPTYMAATESAKAKSRSMSSPRLRPISLDTYSDTTSPYKHKLSPISSINSEATSISRIVNIQCRSFSQRSPSLKGVPGPVKSKRSLKDLSFNSECSLPNWDRHGAFR